MSKLYIPSGRSPLLGFFVALALGAILALFLAFAYNFLLVVMPIIYVCVVVSIGFGLILGYAIKYFSRFTKIRNHRQNIALAGLLGFIGFYLQWIAYFSFLNSGEHSFESYQSGFSLILNPRLFSDMILELNRMGSWQMFGVQFTDFPLWFIWFLEAFFIIGIPMLIAIKHPIVPFSEKLNQWYSKYDLKFEFQSIASQNQFKEELFNNPVLAISNLNYGSPYRFAKISIFYLKNEDTQYLSVDNMFIEDQGKGKTTSTSVIHLLAINTNISNELMDKYGSVKKLLLDF